jgi:hypothetical protein
MELCGSFLSGEWPARAGECPPWISVCGSRFAYPASFCVDLGFWRSLDTGKAPGVGACSSQPELRWRFSWCWFLVSSVCIFTFFSLFTVYLLVAASSQDFPDFVDKVSSASFTALAYGLVVAFGQWFQLLYSCICYVALALLYSPLGFLFCNEGSWSLFQKKKKKKQKISYLLNTTIEIYFSYWNTK